MSGALQRLNLLALSVLAAVLGCVLAAQTWPAVAQLARVRLPENPWDWPKTLEVYPSHPGDPVKLVRIMEDGNEVVPGAYTMPEIAGDGSQTVDAVNEWLKDASFTLKSQSSKNIVSVGLSVVFPVRSTDVDCPQINGHKSARDPWCDAHPHYCDGGCPELIRNTLHWGLIPGLTASFLEARYARARAEGEYWRRLLQGKEGLRLAPGEQVTLSLAGRVDGSITLSDPRHGITDIMNGIVGNEGIDEAKDTEPCIDRVSSKTGCAFSEVAKFNIGLDIVYFEDGTIWGNYGFGYAFPNPDGIYTRVQARDPQGDLGPPPETN
jgi:hypothetical protein